ncbi:MAG: hypothetical protein JZU47_14260 [Prolixibacteraceae bacterium]|nr:hypothetical protein [Prolixibacteraceae bacterium]
MQKISRTGRWLILILIFLFQLQTHAQSKKYFVVTGKIVPEVGSAGTGYVEIKKNETDISNIEIPKNGRFRLELDFFNEYYLTFKYPGHFDKIILVSTEIPKEVWERDNDFPPYSIFVQMLAEIEGLDKSFTLKPQGRIFYSKGIDNFEKESLVPELEFKEQIETAKAKASQVKKEAQSISKEDAQDLAVKQKNFDQLIKEADGNYQRGEYQMALLKYTDARKLFPEKAYPNDRVAELQDLVKALEITEKQKAELEQKYKASIEKANGFFDKKTYLSARTLYEEALQFKPGDVYANGRISEIDQLLALQQKQKQYSDLIAQADKNYKSKNFDQALTFYNQANQVIPDDQYPKDQINLINAEKLNQSKLQQIEKDYNQTLQTAITQTQQKDYMQALNSYKKALELKPDSKLAKDKIAETELALLNLETDKKYQQTIQLADQALAAKDFEKAKMQYQEALKLKTSETYPKNKLDEIAQSESKEAEFNGLVANAEKALTSKSFDESLQLFNQALELKPKNPAVQKRIDEIQTIRKQQLSDNEYTSLIAQADQAFQGNQMDASLSAYNKALLIKKEEAYPKDQIKKIELYQSLIKKADKSVGNKDYTEAVSTFNEALALKPNDTFTKEKIAEIEKLLSEKKKLDEQALASQNAYNELIKTADQFFTAQNYSESLAKYKEALTLKASESYPGKRIKEIENILGQLAKDQAKKDKEYQTAIAQADNLLEKKDYANAQAGYRKAIEIKPEEIYPKDQIKKIDDTLAEIRKSEQENQQLAKEKADQEFNLAMANADKAFSANDFNLAKTGYQTALTIKQNDAVAKEKLGQTEAKLGQLAKMTQAYNAAITEANRRLTDKKYQDAKDKYQEALQYLPDSEDAKKQIVKIDEILAQQEAEIQLKQEFNLALAEGETLLKNKDLAKAKDAFTKANKLIPTEPVPPKRISEINDLLAAQAKKESELKATLEAYQKVIQRADAEFGNKEYIAARLIYNEALQIKSDEKYPTDQLNLISKLLNDQNDQQYSSAIAMADNSFNANQFDQAKSSYQEALKFKKDDPYAIRRIKETDQKKAELEAENSRLKKLQDEYNTTIADAGTDFKNKEYQKAKGKYQKALTLKPEETLPKEQIARIDQLLGELQQEAETNRLYVQHVKSAQEAFAQKKLKEARDEYQKANDLKPSEPIPPAKLTEIDKMLAQQAELAQLAAQEEAQRLAKEKADKEQYSNALAAADKAFAEKQYKTARTHYGSALVIQANEIYPKDQIAKIDKLLSQQEIENALAMQKAQQDSLQKAKDRLFNIAMSAAKEHEQNKEYEQAITKYGDAIQVNPSQKSTIQKLITDLQAKIQLIAKQELEYNRIIKLADEQFTDSKLEEALVQYKNALTIKPEEEYSTKQIAEIQSIFTSREQNYTNAIQKADKAFDASDWLAAKDGYNEALAVKPKETYPINRLKEVNQKISDSNLAAQAKANEDKAYAEAIDKGEKAMKDDQPASAKMHFEVAKSLKPTEKLPVDRIREIEALLDQRNKDRLAQAQKEIDEKYGQVLTLADNSFSEKSYSISKLQYKQALLIKPEESYPKNQIALIDKLLSEAKPVETYVPKLPEPEKPKVAATPIFNPAESVQSTEARAKSFEITANYDEAVKKADDSFGIKDYTVARFFYLKASDIRPKEEYPKNQVELIRKLIDSQLSANDISGYDNAISQADAAFSGKKYTVAKFFYYKAIDIKSWEKYPKDRINEILALTNSLLSEKEEKEYSDAIAKADEAFYNKDIAIARFYYNKASSIKIEENYPKIKLKEVQKLIDQSKLDQQNEEYRKILELADDSFQSGNFSIARFNYNKALTIKPDEKYPKDQLKRIKEALDTPKK